MKQILLFVLPLALSAQQEWRTWSGGNDGNRYSPLKQINKSNVKQLKVAWEYHSGDADPRGRTNNECTPIVVNGIVYGTTPTEMAVAIDGATGKELWRFEPARSGSQGVNRGLMYWKDKDEERIFFPASKYLYALNAKTGKVMEGQARSQGRGCPRAGLPPLHAVRAQEARGRGARLQRPGAELPRDRAAGARGRQAEDRAGRIVCRHRGVTDGHHESGTCRQGPRTSKARARAVRRARAQG